MQVNLGGELIDKDQAGLSVDNRGLLYGDAVFETMRYSGGKLLFWEDHYFRLMASMRIMRMDIPMDFTPEYLEEEVSKTLEANDLQNKTVRIRLTVWRNSGGRYTPTDNEVGYMIITETIDQPFYTIEDSSYEVELYKDFYVNSGLLSTLKSNNRLINVLGSIYAEENGYDNCLLLNEKKQVIEALNGNLFLVQGYKIKTPPLADGCLKGILRKKLIEIIGTVPDFVLEESSVSPFELQKADEMFVTNVISGITPVTKYRKKNYDSKVARELLGKLNTKARFD